MTTRRPDNAPSHPNTAVVTNDPTRLPRRQRLGSAIASAVVSIALLGGVAFGMADAGDAPGAMAGEPAAAVRA